MNIDTMSLDDLVKAYKKHNHLYWVVNKPEISDQDFDLIERKIRQLDPNHPALDKLHHAPINSPVKHDPPMLSMNKAYSLDEVEKWAKGTGDTKFMSSPKMDGTACELRYYKGRLVQASTRGTGTKGEDITQNVLRIKNVPKKISYQGTVYIRGEVIMPLSVFNKKFAGSNSNARNLAAGSLKHKDPEESEKRGLVFYAYEVIGNPALKSEHDEFQFLRDNKFRHVEIHFAEVDDLERIYNLYLDKRDEFDFEIDGVIFTANNVDIQGKLGANSHHPRFAIAWKIQGESSTTTLKDIEWSVSRTGQVTPVAIVEPVQLSGAMVSKASVHHAGFVLSKKLSKGATIEMTRRGGVIPHLERVTKAGSQLFQIPTQVDGYDVEMVDDFLYLKEPEKHPVVQVARLTHFCKVIEADGWGDKILAQLYKAGLLKSFSDLYTITGAELMNGIERSGARLVSKLLTEMNKHRELELAVFLRALGIDELGKSISKQLAEEYKTLDRVRQVTRTELEALDGVGEKIAEAVVSGLHKNSSTIDQLLKHVTVKDYQKVVKTGKFSGKSFVFTGTLSHMGRKDAQKLVVSLGGETPSSVSKDLTYLVVGGDDTNSTKYKKATSLNSNGSSIEIISEDDFVAMTK